MTVDANRTEVRRFRTQGVAASSKTGSTLEAVQNSAAVRTGRWTCTLIPNPLFPVFSFWQCCRFTASVETVRTVMPRTVRPPRLAFTQLLGWSSELSPLFCDRGANDVLHHSNFIELNKHEMQNFFFLESCLMSTHSTCTPWLSASSLAPANNYRVNVQLLMHTETDMQSG